MHYAILIIQGIIGKIVCFVTISYYLKLWTTQVRLLK